MLLIDFVKLRDEIHDKIKDHDQPEAGLLPDAFAYRLVGDAVAIVVRGITEKAEAERAGEG